MQPVSEIVLDFTSFHVGYCRGPLAMTQRGAPWRIARFPAGIAVLRHPQRGTILFDTGYGALFEQATKPFPERIYRWLTPVTFNPDDSLPKQLEKYGFASPDLVFLSHLHADHVAGLFDLAKIPQLITSHAAIEKLQPGRLATLKAGCPAMIRDKLQSLNLHRPARSSISGKAPSTSSSVVQSWSSRRPGVSMRRAPEGSLKRLRSLVVWRPRWSSARTS